MARALKELEDIIFREKYEKRSEWDKVDREVEAAWEIATEEARREFEDSGAGDMIGQLLEFM